MMEKRYSEELLNEIRSKFPQASVKIHAPRRVYVRIPRDQVPACARYMHIEKGLRFSIATGIDTRDGIEIIYHFSMDAEGTYYNIKTVIPKDDTRMQSLTDFLPAADWIEREIHELLGVDFVGHPNLKPLLTAESWPADLYPLRRDYAGEHKDLDKKPPEGS
jgi:Ni,Fe-hydrogenase III component G